jgi:hypothetical protein
MYTLYTSGPADRNGRCLPPLGSRGDQDMAVGAAVRSRGDQDMAVGAAVRSRSDRHMAMGAAGQVAS